MSDVILSAKRVWGYGDEFISTVQTELVVIADDNWSNRCFVAERLLPVYEHRVSI
jgi:hypothetical protein